MGCYKVKYVSKVCVLHVCRVLTEPGGPESLTLSEVEPVQGSAYVLSARFPPGNKTSLIPTVTCQGRKEEVQSPSYRDK